MPRSVVNFSWVAYRSSILAVAVMSLPVVRPCELGWALRSVAELGGRSSPERRRGRGGARGGGPGRRGAGWGAGGSARVGGGTGRGQRPAPRAGTTSW